MVARLTIQEVAGKCPRYILWPSEHPLPHGAIQETGTYYLELIDEADTEAVEKAELFIDGQPLEALRAPVAGMSRWRWSPGFHAGKVQISIEIPGRAASLVEVVTDPRLEKLTRDDFNVMVRDILHDTKALFALSGFRTGIARGTGGSTPPIARLEFLRSRLFEIETVVNEICDKSVCVLRPQDEVVPIHKVRQIRPSEYVASLRRGRVVDTTSVKRLAVSYLPYKVQKTRKVTGADIREHRDIKRCLGNWQRILKVFGDKLGSMLGTEEDDTKQAIIWAKRCEVMSRRLGNLLEHRFFSEVEDHVQPVVMTSIYRNVPVYRRFFNLYRDIEAGISNVLGDYLDLPLARTFELYELWTFLRLVRAATQLYGLDMVPSDLFKKDGKPGTIRITPERVTVDLRNGFGLIFKRRYREYWLQKDKLGSFSRVMEPDISLLKKNTGEGPTKLVVLDAKYRIQTGLNDAISSIHMYRDAIVDGKEGRPAAMVVGAYLLSPHRPYWKGDWRDTKMPGRLFHPEYRGQFSFGAVNLYPGMAMGEVCACLATMIEDAQNSA